MHGDQLIFSRGGVGQNGPRGPQRLYKVSPYLYPQYGDYNRYFLPDGRELPAHGLQAQILTFDFGFSIPAQTIAPMDSQFFQVALSANFLALAVTGFSGIPASQNATTPVAGTFPGVQTNPAYLVTFQQTHAGNTWQWVNKAVTNVELCGAGENPLMFTSPVLIPAGDTIGCTVQNMANTSLLVQVVFTGASF